MTKPLSAPLIVGTVQWGLPYGIANQTGPPSESELEKMLAIVAKHNLYGFDTAQSYGNSEARLGRLLGKKAARISTKLSPQLSHHTHMQTALANSLTQSLKNLNRKKIWMLMLHRFDWLADWSLGLGHFFETEKKANRIEQVGVSVYNAKEAIEALHHPDIDGIQMPFNAFDISGLTEGVFDLAKEKNKVVTLRSVFLQGLLTLPPKTAEKRLPGCLTACQIWHDSAKQLGLSPDALAIKIALQPSCPLVIGMETSQQCQNNITLMQNTPLPLSTIQSLHATLSPHLTKQIINPSLW